MECVLILKGRYWDENRFKDDEQYINLFEEGTPLNLSFKNRVIEDAWYSAKVKISGHFKPVEKIELMINDEQISCLVSNQSQKENDIEFSLVIPDEKRQLFLLYYEFVTIRLIIPTNETYKIFFSKEIPCVSKNINNFRNVEQMISEILDFEDEEINQWVYNINSNSSNVDYGIIQGAFKRNTHKSLFSFIQLLKEIHNSYYKNIYLFKNQTKHIVINNEKMIPYERVKSIGSSEFIWLMHNSEQLMETRAESTISYKGINYLPRKVRANETVRNKDVYENRIIYSFLKLIVNKLTLIRVNYRDGVIKEKEILAKLSSFKDEGFSSPIILIKESQIKKWDYFLKELDILVNSFQKLLVLFLGILECQEIKLDCLPRKTKTFQAIKHYNEIYTLILKWYKYGEFNLHKEELLLKVKKVDKIFEYYSLMTILKKAKEMGYILDRRASGANYYKYWVKDTRYEEADVNNTYCLTNGFNKLTIYYQPVLFSFNNNDTNNISLFRTDSDHYWIPDFIFKMHNPNMQNDFYAISDAKYSNRKNIRDRYLPLEMVKYVCSVADKTGQTPAVRFMWLLQGRDHHGSQTEYFHSSKLSKLVKPIPSYGIHVLNPSNNDLNEFWNELMRCI